MGLDSMKIFDTVERYFKVSLSEDEVDSISTVGDIADCVSRHIVFKQEGISKPEMMFDILKDYVPAEFGYPAEEFTLATVIKDFIPAKKAQLYWDKMAADFNIELPLLKPADITTHISAGDLVQVDSLTDNTVFDLMCWILALNYEKLIIPGKLVSKTEVELAVMGIVNEIAGINIEDIALEYDILEDLGIR